MAEEKHAVHRPRKKHIDTVVCFEESDRSGLLRTSEIKTIVDSSPWKL